MKNSILSNTKANCFSIAAVAALTTTIASACLAQHSHNHGHGHTAHKATPAHVEVPSTLPDARPIPFAVLKKGATRAHCFPVERLSKEKRQRAEELLLRICDSEALYTLVGAVKPMSTDWLIEDFDFKQPGAVRLDEVREILSVLYCGDEISAHMLRFSHVHNGKLRFKAALFNRVALAEEINRHASFWQARAITPNTEPVEVLLNNEDERTDRFERVRAYGYLAGYPEEAVHTYLDIIKKKFADPEHKPIPVDYVRIPTYAKNVYGFVYSVPKGHQLTQADRDLIAKCAPILEEYKKRRAKYIGEGKAGIVALLRDWFHDGKGNYSPRFARY